MLPTRMSEPMVVSIKNRLRSILLSLPLGRWRGGVCFLFRTNFYHSLPSEPFLCEVNVRREEDSEWHLSESYSIPRRHRLVVWHQAGPYSVVVWGIHMILVAKQPPGYVET